MHNFIIFLQIAVALGLLNVWLLRVGRSTGFRGGDAHSMREEFAVYGLPAWSMQVVGTLKIAAAVCLIAGIWFRYLVLPAAVIVCVLMVGALAMHLKVRDSLKKSLPALMVLAACATICWSYTR